MGGHMMEKQSDLEDKPSDVNQRDSEEAHVFSISAATILFQFLMMLSAMYMSMLCTNWGNISIFNDTVDFYTANDTSFWLKIVCQWISMSVYIFSLLAPLIFPDRDF